MWCWSPGGVPAGDVGSGDVFSGVGGDVDGDVSGNPVTRVSDIMGWRLDLIL